MSIKHEIDITFNNTLYFSFVDRNNRITLDSSQSTYFGRVEPFQGLLECRIIGPHPIVDQFPII